MDAARDAGERDVVMQMRGRRDGDGIDAELEQRLDVGDGGAAERARDEIGLPAVGIGHRDELGARQAGENARMVRAHDADADHADTQVTLRARICRLRHALTISPRPQRPSAASLARFRRRRIYPTEKTVNTF